MDLDNDGHKDMLTGSWPGELFWFRGKGSGEYEKSVMLKDAEDNVICIGGGIDETDDGITITGHAEFKEIENGENYVIYHGKRIESTMERQVLVTGTASVVHAVDWDNDGDLDVVAGNAGQQNTVYFNEGGTPVKFRASSFGDPMAATYGVAVGDMDGDGFTDVVVANSGSENRVFLNRPIKQNSKTP